MAELAVNNAQGSSSRGFMPEAGSLMAQAKELWNSPAFRRSLPTIVAVVVTLMGLMAYFVMQQPSRTTLYASLPEAEKSRVLEALQNAGVDVALDPTTGDVMVPSSDYIPPMTLAAQGRRQLYQMYENLDAIQMGSSRSVEAMRLKQTQELELVSIAGMNVFRT